MKNVDCIFLCKVEKDEIINFVKDCANKGSTDYEDLDILMKNRFEIVIEPFTFI